MSVFRCQDLAPRFADTPGPDRTYYEYRKQDIIGFSTVNRNYPFERLSIGDYQADNRLLFERKTLKDFAKSITAERHELQAVEGIGDTIADGIKSAVNEQISCYGFDEDFPV